MNNITKCCCVVLNYNDSDTTRALIGSIKNYAVFSHIIIIDNASSDDSVSELSKECCDNIHLIVNRKNGGYGYGNNIGVRTALEQFKSKYALIVNPDVLFSEATVSNLISIMNNNPDCAISSCIQLNVDKKMIRAIAWHLPTYKEYVFGSLYFMSKMFNNYNYKIEELKSQYNIVDCVPGSLLMVDTEKFVNIGGYDEEMFLYCEETTIGNKVKRNRYTTILDIRNTYIHNHSVSINKSVSSIIQQRKILFQSRYVYLRNYLKAGVLKLFLAKIIFDIALLEERIKAAIKSKGGRTIEP